ncbi:MAG: peptide-methionine (S)-S-oxide reductase MsrA [Pseudomonadota bacterium]
MVLFRKSLELPSSQDALAGRDAPLPTQRTHSVLGNPLQGPFPSGIEVAYFGLGCFWGAERIFWQARGVFTTAVGYQGGHTPNPTYEEVCSGRTGHTEAVLVAYDPDIVSFGELLQLFWEAHNPTQYMRQGNDVGTQYRGAIYTTTEAQRATAEHSKEQYGALLRKRGLGEIATEIGEAGPFYYAEAYHQQYLAKNPNGYCGLAGTGVACPVPSTAMAPAPSPAE